MRGSPPSPLRCAAPDIAWPTPKRKFDETFQKEVETYREHLSIKVPVTVLGAWAAYKPMGATLESTRAIYEGQYKALPQVKIRMSENGYHFLPWDDTALVVDAGTPGFEIAERIDVELAPKRVYRTELKIV